MNTITIDMVAGDIVRAGVCDGRCLVASGADCDCVCAGRFHGALASCKITGVEVVPVTRPRVPVADQGSQERTRVVAALVGGATIKQAADSVGWSTIRVRRALKEFETEEQ